VYPEIWKLKLFYVGLGYVAEPYSVSLHFVKRLGLQ